MIHRVRDDLIQVRHFGVSSYMLLSDKEIVLIDGGFIGGIRRLERTLREAGRSWADIRAVLLTHGHLDHTLNIAEIREKSRCVVYAHEADQRHIAACYPYQGLSRCCGILETLGRSLLGYQAPHVDVWIKGEMELPFWGGLTVIPLPGHTAGHCGYFSRRSGLFFVGDSFASWSARARMTPPWFTTDMDAARKSLLVIRGIDPAGMLANHCDRASPEKHRERFYRMLTPET